MKEDTRYWESAEGCARIEGWARDGCSYAEIAGRMGVSETTLRRIRRAHPAIDSAIQNGRATTDDRVEKALLKKALGYRYT